jgi:hypothetical protein
MKKLAILTVLFITVLSTRAQVAGNSAVPPPNTAASQMPNPNGTAIARPADVLQIKENSHNFGKIPQGRPATYIFDIVNTGNTPLKLDNVHASCGCTTPEWSREAIPAGATAEIKVGYNAYSEGTFSKTVTIVYNTNQTKLLTISGEVYKVPQTSAPENASVQLLKQVN